MLETYEAYKFKKLVKFDQNNYVYRKHLEEFHFHIKRECRKEKIILKNFLLTNL
jgi:hypothetical protein